LANLRVHRTRPHDIGCILDDNRCCRLGTTAEAKRADSDGDGQRYCTDGDA
jgi:hypothetical protein